MVYRSILLTIELPANACDAAAEIRGSFKFYLGVMSLELSGSRAGVNLSERSTRKTQNPGPGPGSPRLRIQGQRSVILLACRYPCLMYLAPKDDHIQVSVIEFSRGACRSQGQSKRERRSMGAQGHGP